MKKNIITITLILFALLSFAAFEYVPGNVKVKSMRYCTSSLLMGIENAMINPASITATNISDISLSYENLYGFTHSFALSGSYMTQYGVMGAKFSEYFVLGDYANSDSIISTGTRMHTERIVNITYGIPLANVLSFGTNINLLYLEQIDNGSNIYYTIDMGLIGTIYKRWNLGIAVKNITNSYIAGIMTSNRYYIERVVSAGISFEPYDNFITSFDVSKSAGWPTSFGGAVNYEIVEDVFIVRCGVRSFPIEYSGGFEIILNKFSIDYGYSANQYVNGIHLIQLNYNF